jgi:GNAT superfamily N-acetyltransferase
MTDSRFQLITPATRADYQTLVEPLADACWPEFMLHDPIADQYWNDLFERFSEYQFGLLDTETGQAAAMGNSLPLHWDGDPRELPEGGFDWAMQQAVQDHQAGLEPRTQCAIQIAIHPDHQGQGLSSHMVGLMRQIGEEKGFRQLIAPVRPNQKSQYPLTDIDRYITWLTDEGLPFDAWLRVHVRLGARIIKPCHQAMLIPGTLAQWSAWTGMKFPESGRYIVPGGLNPIDVDVAADEGVYLEPNVWTVHSLVS